MLAVLCTHAYTCIYKDLCMRLYPSLVLYAKCFCVFDCYLVVRNWSVTFTCKRVIVLCERLISKSFHSSKENDDIQRGRLQHILKSDWDASGHFFKDESLLSKNDESSRLNKHCSNKMALLRRRSGVS